MALYETVYPEVYVGGNDISDVVVFAQSQFTISAAAQPGTCQIALKVDIGWFEGGLTEGQLIELIIWPNSWDEEFDPPAIWRGYLMQIEHGYIFPDDPGDAKLVLSGVDLNVVLDKTIMYNHANPAQYPTGGGTYKRKRVVEDGTTYGYIVTVPRYTYDRSYIKAMLNDFDLPPEIKWQGADSKIEQVGMINPDGNFTPPSAGTTLRNFLTDVSTNVARSTPGSTIWYIDPEGYIVYKEQDLATAPFWVGDDDPATYYSGVQGENVRDLRVTSDISQIKNDVLIFTGTLDPQPESTQEHLLYKHKINQSSVNTYGRFQYSEVLNQDWLQGAVNAKANKIIYQQGDLGKSAEFTTYRPGLYPGMLVNVISNAHSIEENFPIRAMTMRFPQPNICEYQVSCSYDTQDPWGLLLALKRPVTRGLTNPNFEVIDRRKNPNAPIAPAEPYTYVKEYPRSLGGGRYECSYAYIRDSITVFVGNLRQVGVQDPEAGTVAFLETSPTNGIFKLSSSPTGGKKVYVEYHVWHNL